MYLPAKFKFRFLEPVALDGYGPRDADDMELVQWLAEDIRAKIQLEVGQMTAERASIWFG